MCLFIANRVLAVDSSDGDFSLYFPDSPHGFHIGDTCIESCSSVISHSFCNETTHTCQCLESHPIVIEAGVACAARKEEMRRGKKASTYSAGPEASLTLWYRIRNERENATLPRSFSPPPKLLLVTKRDVGSSNPLKKPKLRLTERPLQQSNSAITKKFPIFYGNSQQMTAVSQNQD